MSSTWFTSDTHFHHKNIVRGTSDWKDTLSNGQEASQRTRDFDTLEEHDKALVEGINRVVKPDDTLWHLGDWSFGGIEQIWNFRKQIKCKNIHLIYGNHDHHIEDNKHIPNAKRKELYSPELIDGKPIGGDYCDYASMHDLFRSRPEYYAELHIGGMPRIIISHFAFRVWNKSHHGAIHLYGHSHDSLDSIPYGKSMDVGVDSAKRILGEYRPFHVNEIKEIMREREALFVDHHNKNTN